MKDDFSEKLGGWLAEKRIQSGMTQVQVAERWEVLSGVYGTGNMVTAK